MADVPRTVPVLARNGLRRWLFGPIPLVRRYLGDAGASPARPVAHGSGPRARSHGSDRPTVLSRPVARGKRRKRPSSPAAAGEVS